MSIHPKAYPSSFTYLLFSSLIRFFYASGSTASGTEAEYDEDEEENDATEKATLDKSLYKAAIHDDLEQAMDSTPLGIGRYADFKPFLDFSHAR